MSDGELDYLGFTVWYQINVLVWYRPIVIRKSGYLYWCSSASNRVAVPVQPSAIWPYRPAYTGTLTDLGGALGPIG
jgi:hypothetical protein